MAIVFGTPILLKRKADQMGTAAVPPPPTPPVMEPTPGPTPLPHVSPPTHPTPMTSHPCPPRAHSVLHRVEQMMGVAATAMLHQQGAMREAASWQVKVEDAMREIAKVLEENREQ